MKVDIKDYRDNDYYYSTIKVYFNVEEYTKYGDLFDDFDTYETDENVIILIKEMVSETPFDIILEEEKITNLVLKLNKIQEKAHEGKSSIY